MNIKSILGKWRFKAELLDLYSDLLQQILLNASLQVFFEHRAETREARKDVTAVIYQDITFEIIAGKDLHEALEPYIPNAHIEIIRTHSQNNDLANAFSILLKSTRLINEVKKVIFSSAVAISIPLLLIIFWSVAVIPKQLLMVKDITKKLPDTIINGALFTAELYVKEHALIMGPALVAVFVVLAWSVPGLRKGALRNYLIRLPPWSFYHKQQGINVLISLATQFEYRTSISDALERLHEHASRSTASYLDEMLDRVEAGYTLAQTLDVGFFDEKFIEKATLAERGGYMESLFKGIVRQDLEISVPEITKPIIRTKNLLLIILYLIIVIIFGDFYAVSLSLQSTIKTYSQSQIIR